MDTLPDPGTFDLFRASAPGPDLDRIEAALRRSETIAAGLADKFPRNEIFASYHAAAREGLALVAWARLAEAKGDRTRLEAVAIELTELFEAQGRSDRLADWGLLPHWRRTGTGP